MLQNSIDTMQSPNTNSNSNDNHNSNALGPCRTS